MVRAIEYPRASLSRALELASAVDELGGEAGLEAAAESTGHAPGGAFTALVAAAAKYGWLTVRRGRLRTTPALRDLRLAGEDGLRRRGLAQALTTPPLYAKLLDRFAGRALPEAALPRVLAREYAVPESAAPRIARYFADGARMAGLIEGGVVLRPGGAGAGSPREGSAPHDGSSAAGTGSAFTDADEAGAAADTHGGARYATTLAQSPALVRSASRTPSVAAPRSTGATPHEAERRFTLDVRGPGLTTTVEIGERADLALARALLDRVERALVAAEETSR